MAYPTPRSSFRSPRFAQPPTFMRLPHREDSPAWTSPSWACRTTAGRRYRVGSRHGPREIRSQSSLIRTYSYFQQVRRSTG